MYMISRALYSVNKSIDNLLSIVKNYVSKNGDFINTSIKGNDVIYAYTYNYDTDNVDEAKVIAIMVEDDELFVALSPTSCNMIVQDKTDFNDDDWYLVSNNGAVLLAQTIISIAQSIEQYV